LRKLLEIKNISIVKELLRHSSLQVSKIYSQFPLDYLAQVFKERKINLMSGAIPKA